MKIDLSGKGVLITGGGAGLGFAIANAFTSSGAQVVISGRREEVLQEACDKLGNRCRFIVNDVSDVTKTAGLVDMAVSMLGRIDILVNNAGVNMKKPFQEVTDEDFSAIIQTNLAGVFALSRDVAKRMMADDRGGSILMITSMAAIYGIPQVSAYTASKSAISGLTRSMAVDLAPYGIRVNAIAPGFIDSAMLRKAFAADPQREQKVLSRTPLKRLGQPDDIARAALFLSSDAAGFITGVQLPVDGGNSIGF